MWKLVLLGIVLILATIVGIALYENQKSGVVLRHETDRVISLPWLIPRTQTVVPDQVQQAPPPPAEPLFTPLPENNLSTQIPPDSSQDLAEEAHEFPRQEIAISPTTPQPPVTQPQTAPNSTVSPAPNPTVTPPNPAVTPGAKPEAKPKPAEKKAAAPAAQRKISGDFVNGEMKLGREIDKNGFHKNEPVVVIVDKGSHFTYILQKQAKDNVVKVMSISNSIGKDSTPTPYGRFWVADKTKWPAWVPPKSIDPKQKAIHPYNKDRNNPLGVARVRLNKWDIALHGTNNPNSIRKDVSHGCIRHSNQDIMKLYNMVKVGTPVYITRNFAGTTLKRSDFDITKSSW